MTEEKESGGGFQVGTLRQIFFSRPLHSDYLIALILLSVDSRARKKGLDYSSCSNIKLDSCKQVRACRQI